MRELSHNRLPPLLGPGYNLARERIWTNHNTIRIPRHAVHIQLHHIALLVSPRADIEGPQHLRDCDKERPLGEVNARAQTAADTVTVVVAGFVVGEVRVIGGQSGFAIVVGEVERRGVGELVGVVV